MENPTAPSLARSSEVGFLCPGIGGRIIFPEIIAIEVPLSLLPVPIYPLLPMENPTA